MKRRTSARTSVISPAAGSLQANFSIHSYLDGFAIGIGFQFGAQVGLIIATAVIFHDFSDGLNTVTLMQRSGTRSRDSLKMLMLDATTPILGVVTTLFFTFSENILILLLPFFAGGFLYLGASDLLPEAHERNSPLMALIMSLLGFLLIFIVTGLLNV
jgi:ZIP family zinc transporter